MKKLILIFLFCFGFAVYGQNKTVFFNYNNEDFKMHKSSVILIKDSTQYLSRFYFKIINEKKTTDFNLKEAIDFKQIILKENLRNIKNNSIDITKLIKYLIDKEIILVSKENDDYHLYTVRGVLENI